MADNTGEQPEMQSGDINGDDLSHLFKDESGAEEIISVTDETLAFLHTAFAADPVDVDSFLSLNFFTFG